MTTKQEQRDTVEYLKDAGILPPEEDPQDYPPLVEGQVWVGGGKVYRVLGDDGRRVQVEILDKDGNVAASGRPWSFTHEQFHSLAKESGLRIQDTTASLDDIAERLEHTGHPQLAAALDEITAKRGVNKRARAVDNIEQEIRILTNQLEEAKDPKNVARLTSQLAALTKDLISQGVDKAPGRVEISPPQEVSAPNTVTKPYLVTKGAQEDLGDEPDPEEDPEQDEEPIRQRQGPESTFIIGDDIIKVLSDVASKLYDLDEGVLAEQVVNFLVENLKES